MFSLKRRWKDRPPPQEEEKAAADPDDGDDQPAEEAIVAKPPAPGGKLKTILAIAIVTVIAGGLGAALGMQTASEVAATIAERARAKLPEEAPRSTKYTGDMVLQALEPIVTNLAQPSDTWIRLETAIVFANGAVKNPDVTGAEIRQDLIAYARTINLAQLEGPSALQHLREDLNERVSVRTNGEVSELIIQALIVQ